MHSEARDAHVLLGIELLQAVDKEQRGLWVSDLFRGAREDVHKMELTDPASVGVVRDMSRNFWTPLQL